MATTPETAVKPGYLTTEFWSHAFIQVTGLLTLLHVITPDLNARMQPYADIAALLAMAAASVVYQSSRKGVKASAATAAAALLQGRYLNIGSLGAVIDQTTGEVRTIHPAGQPLEVTAEPVAATTAGA